MRRVMSCMSVMLGFMLPLPALAADCPVPVETLSKQLGQNLKVVFQGRALIGNGCEYQNEQRTLKISIDAGPSPMPADMWRKMSKPPGSVWRSIPNDPDKAVVLDKTPNGVPEPTVSYERKGWLVEIVVMQVGREDYRKWTERALQLKRIPE